MCTALTADQIPTGDTMTSEVDDIYSAYQSPDGPVLVPSAVLLMDVLGTSARRTPEESLRHLRVTQNAFSEAQKVGDSKRGNNGLTIATWFTDNLAMALPVPESGGLRAGDAISLLVMYAALHQVTLAEHGLYTRGAITFGPAYADEEFLYGKALVEAHHLESEVAVSPRVILSDKAYDALRNDRVEDENLLGEDYLRAGDDSWPFVDFLAYADWVGPDVGSTLTSLVEGLRGALVDAHRPKDRTKLRWLAGYFNGRLGGGFAIEGVSGRDYAAVGPGS